MITTYIRETGQQLIESEIYIDFLQHIETFILRVAYRNGFQSETDIVSKGKCHQLLIWMIIFWIFVQFAISRNRRDPPQSGRVSIQSLRLTILNKIVELAGPHYWNTIILMKLLKKQSSHEPANPETAAEMYRKYSLIQIYDASYIA